jgi:hypothetical protein
VCVRVWFCVVAVSEDGMVTIIRDLRLYLYIYIYIYAQTQSVTWRRSAVVTT